MNNYQSVFRRYEKKYLLNQEQFDSLYPVLMEHFQLDKYGKSTVYNIYFDTPDALLIRRSLEKPVYKEKLRLRSYRCPKENDEVFVELKKKYKGVVYKRRINMSYKEALAYLYNHKPALEDSQITHEIDWTLHFYENLGPAMFISYDRLALSGKEDPTLRITFDTNILWRTDDLFLDGTAPCNELLAPDQHLMEIKVFGAMPLWLADILDRLQIFPTSFSKYGKAYLQNQMTNTHSEVFYA